MCDSEATKNQVTEVVAELHINVFFLWNSHKSRDALRTTVFYASAFGAPSNSHNLLVQIMSPIPNVISRKPRTVPSWHKSIHLQIPKNFGHVTIFLPVGLDQFPPQKKTNGNCIAS